MNRTVKLEIEVDDDGTTHATITCGTNKGFNEVLGGLLLAQRELARQIEERMKCPFAKTETKKTRTYEDWQESERHLARAL